MTDSTNLIAVFVFYRIATGVQAWLSFSEEFKHCNIITYDGSDWIMLDFDRSGLLTRKIKCPDGDSLIKNLPVIKDVTAIVTVSVNERHKSRWFPWWVRSCNEVCRYASGVDIGFTFNPVHLYSKLLKYRHSRNYEVLSAWRRTHGIFRGRQQSAKSGRRACD
jgi:hypothetical protein